MDWCEFFRKIEENPKAIVKGLKVRDVYEARQHISTCDTCFNRTERTLAKAPPEKGIQMGLN